MVGHEVRDVPDHRVGQLQPLEDFLRHRGGHPLVAVEGRPAIGSRAQSARLADVVKERRQPQHKGLARRRVAGVQGVPEHVVAMEASLRNAFPLQQLGEHDPEDPRFPHQGKPDGGHGGLEDLEDLVAHPFGGNLCKDVEAPGDGCPRSLLDGEPKLRGKPAGAQGTQAVLPETLRGIADGPQDALSQVPPSLVRVGHAVGQQVIGDGVDREVPPGKVVDDRRAERHGVGPPPVAVVRFRAEGRHLEGRSLKVDRHGAVPDAGRDHAAEQGHDLLGARVGGDVEVGVVPAQEDVADGAADEVALEAGGVETPRRNLGRPGGRA